MQFVKNGPDIPEALLQDHEDGRVIFFCGAGISYPAGLPSFHDLVVKVYKQLRTTRNDSESQAFEKGQYDATLDLLERRIAGRRMTVRTAVQKVLKPRLARKASADTHRALLHLARDRNGDVRLVTTNFDRIFEWVTRRARPSINKYPAPLLPIPKNSRWNGIVYLHGLLPQKKDEASLQRLVLSSGDFGLAYLTERWAARFVSELFRNYVVCFVGYSINDPVLRYMMDALAADRMLGEITPQAYAFAEVSPGEEAVKRVEWSAKGVTPILYEVPSGTKDHSALHSSLKAWAGTYRDGIGGRERIVVEHALTRPMSSTKQDDFVGRVLWALSHDSGLPAKAFADLEPVPPLDWLEPLLDRRYRHADLSRFGVPPRSKIDDTLTFSLARRPSPYTLAPWMAIAGASFQGGALDHVLFHLARWLTRHLDDPNLIWWIAKQGGALHDRFGFLIESRLQELARLEREGKTQELARIRASSPAAIPRPALRTIWRLLLSDRVKESRPNLDFYRWRERLSREGLNTALRMELRQLLAPQVVLRQPYRIVGDIGSHDATLKQLVDWDLVLAAEHVNAALKELDRSEAWTRALPQLIGDFVQLLRDALDLMHDLGQADERADRTHWDMPSISHHWQNRAFHDWVSLVELVRDAWLALREQDIQRAIREAHAWLTERYPTFRRLALFAATFEGIAPGGEWVRWLLSDEAWWLWSVETQRETMRLLVLQGANLTDNYRNDLERAVLAGPPRRMFRDDLEPDKWPQLVAHTTWLRLAKLASGGATLGAEARAKLDELSARNPMWQLATNESDEFSHWMSGTGDPDYEERRVLERAPRDREQLIAWLQRGVPEGLWHEDDWADVCRDAFPRALTALAALAHHDVWPIARWRTALQVWSDDKLCRRAWRHASPLVSRMPEAALITLIQTLTWWFESCAKITDARLSIFLSMAERLLNLEYDVPTDNDDPVGQAINHPLGHIAQALLYLWFGRKPEDNQGLPDDLKPFFTQLCDIHNEPRRNGRVLLATNAIALYRVDRDWAERHLLPLFDWVSQPLEARAAWEGFLWAPRLHRPLLLALKEQFLATASRYTQIGKHGAQYARFLTFVAVDRGDIFSERELRTATEALPPSGLHECVETLVRALQGAGEQRVAYWRNRIRWYLRNIWPQPELTNRMRALFAHLCVVAGDAFPDALTDLEDWLASAEHPDYAIHLLTQSGLSTKFPKESLKFLGLVVSDETPWLSGDLAKCLEQIAQANLGLSRSATFARLRALARRGAG